MKKRLVKPLFKAMLSFYELTEHLVNAEQKSFLKLMFLKFLKLMLLKDLKNKTI